MATCAEGFRFVVDTTRFWMPIKSLVRLAWPFVDGLDVAVRLTARDGGAERLMLHRSLQLPFDLKAWVHDQEAARQSCLQQVV